MCKKKKNIVTLQSKNKNKAFKAEVKFTKEQKHRVVLGYFDYPITVPLQLVLS